MKRNGFIIGVVVVIVLVIAALFGWRTYTARAAAATTNLQTVAVTRGNLVATVSAAGNVTAPQSAAIGFQTTGTVALVNVQVGDTVKAGQVLATLDSTDLELALKQAQANVVGAQANLDATIANSGNQQNQVIAAKAAVDKAAQALQQAQAAYDRIGGDTKSQNLTSSQHTSLQQATDDYNSAVANYMIAVKGVNDTAVRAAQGQLASAQVAVSQAENNLAKTQLTAPFDGTISAVNIHVGDSASSSAAMNVVNPISLQVLVTIAEVDLPKVMLGESAQMTMDALPGKTYTGKVVKIDPAGTITQGVVNYPVTLAILDGDSSILTGMTANVNVVVDQRSDVLMVPTRAVRVQGTLRSVILVSNGQTTQVPVATGLSNDTNIEITSGLHDGDTVALNASQVTTTTGSRGPGGIPFLGR